MRQRVFEELSPAVTNVIEELVYHYRDDNWLPNPFPINALVEGKRIEVEVDPFNRCLWVKDRSGATGKPLSSKLKEAGEQIFLAYYGWLSDFSWPVPDQPTWLVRRIPIQC